MRCFFKVAVDRAARSSRRDHRPPMERRTVRPPRRARDTAAAARLWAEAERLTGVSLTASLARS